MKAKILIHYKMAKKLFNINVIIILFNLINPLLSFYSQGSRKLVHM